MSPTEIRTQLAGLRLTQRWSWEQLAADIARVTGEAVAPSSINRFVRRRRPAYDTTLRVYSQYLEARAAAPAVGR